MNRFNLILPAFLYEQLEKKSMQMGLSKAELLRDLISSWQYKIFSQRNKPVKLFVSREDKQFNFQLESDTHQEIAWNFGVAR